MTIHEEYESSLGKKKRKGLHPVAWLAIAFGGLAFTGVAAVAVAGYFVQREVREVLHEVREAPLKVAARAVNLHPDFKVVETDEGAGTLLVQNLKSGAQSVVKAEDAVDGVLTFRTDEGTFRLDLKGGDNGGRLVVTKDGEDLVRIDASADDNGGSLVIRSSDGNVLRLDAKGHDDGGSLVLTTDDGEVLRFDASGSDDSGWLTVRGADGELMKLDFDGDAVRVETANGVSTFRGMEDGGAIPRWVPTYYDVDDGPQTYTADVDDGSGGAFKFSTDDDIGRVSEFYVEEMEDAGFEVKNQSVDYNNSKLQATLLGERDDRTVSVVLVRAGRRGPTHAFVTYWER